jgi:hypothetical protein
MRDNVQGVFENAREDIKNIISSGNFTPEAIFGELMKGSGANIASLGVEAYEKIKEISVDMSKELLAEFENFGRGFKPSSPTTTTTSATGISKTSDTTSYGNISVLGQTGVNPNFSQGSVPGSPQKPIEVDGDIKVDVQFQNLPTNLTSEQMAEVIKAFNMAINEQSFKNYIINLNRRENSFGPNQMATFQ